MVCLPFSIKNHYTLEIVSGSIISAENLIKSWVICVLCQKSFFHAFVYINKQRASTFFFLFIISSFYVSIFCFFFSFCVTHCAALAGNHYITFNKKCNKNEFYIILTFLKTSKTVMREIAFSLTKTKLKF